MKDVLMILIVILLFSSCFLNQKQTYHFFAIESLPVISGLPDPYRMHTGNRVQNRGDWQAHRHYLKALLEYYQYGQMPPTPRNLKVRIDSTQTVFNGAALEINLEFFWSRNDTSVRFRAGLLKPNQAGKFPVIIKNDLFRFSYSDITNAAKRAKYSRERRLETEQQVFQDAIERGYSICKFVRTDIAPDDTSAFTSPVFLMYPEYEWGVITIWAWTYQLIIDYFETRDDIDLEKIAVTGHSRGGKTALCAGIYDERIAITCPNSSGAGGTASLRFFEDGQKKQLLVHHQAKHRHWWNKRFYEFAGAENKLPFDAHFHKMLIAPRALLNTHARQDYWANPYGTQLTFEAAQSIFDLYEVPENNGMHWRDGGHSQAAEDWAALLDFCDLIYFGKKVKRKFNLPPNPDYSDYRFETLYNWQIPQ